MDNGILASLDLSEETGGENELEIFGEKGRLRVSLTRYDGIRFFSRPNQPGDLRTHLEGMTHSLGELTQVLRRLPQPSDWADAFRCEWAHFMAAIKGREKVGCTLMDGRHALTVALAAVESASTGIPVKVSEAPRKITPVTAYGDRRG
jgi:predicted dehydrogenase